MAETGGTFACTQHMKNHTLVGPITIGELRFALTNTRCSLESGEVRTIGLGKLQ